jgi:hypothetical protein
MNKKVSIWLCGMLLLLAGAATAQLSPLDTIRLGTVYEHGEPYPMVFLPEFEMGSLFMDNEQRIKRQRLRRDVYAVYPYALTAATILKDIHDNVEQMDGRRDRKKYVKSIDKKLDAVFKDQLKNLTIDQGHVLVKLINRQTGRNCYSIIKELKGGISAMVWQGVGVFFKNNLNRDYDPEGDDREIEQIVKEMEASANYRWQLYQQDQLLKKAAVKL